MGSLADDLADVYLDVVRGLARLAVGDPLDPAGQEPFREPQASEVFRGFPKNSALSGHPQLVHIFHEA